jgi:hypothetical protein
MKYELGFYIKKKKELGFYIPEDDILHSHRREILKSYIYVYYFIILSLQLPALSLSIPDSYNPEVL